MLSCFILGFVFWIPTICAGVLTDVDTQNATSLEELVDTKTDIFRQLLNQETLIRMSMVKNVHSLMNDMIEMKESMSTSNKRLYDAEKEIRRLKKKVGSLGIKNHKLEKLAKGFQERFGTIDDKLSKVDENFTKVSVGRAQYEKHVEKRFEDFGKNTSKTLDDIKIEVRYLSVTLLDLNKHTLEFKSSVPRLIEEKVTEHSTEVNISVSEITKKLLTSKEFQGQLVYNLSALESGHSGIIELISDNLNKTVTSLKADMERSQKSQLKLSAAVSSLEVFKMNMSLMNNIATKSSVGFTVGVTSSGSSWGGGILVYPHVITNNGNGYNPSTGKFTAPKDGTYVFYINVNVYASSYIYLDIVLNGSRKVRSMSHNSAQFMTGTNMAVLQLVKGDAVWVQRASGTGYYTQSVPITTFSGFLL